MLTGDSRWIGTSVGRSLGIDTIYAELLPQDKVTQVDPASQRKGGKALAYVGDGINDAPVLARADVGSRWARSAQTRQSRRRTLSS